MATIPSKPVPATTDSLVREYASLRAADAQAALTIAEEKRLGAVVAELIRRGVLERPGSTGPTPTWDQVEARLHAAQRAVNGHAGGNGPASLVIGPLAAAANARARLVDGQAMLTDRLVRDGHTPAEAELLVAELEQAYDAWLGASEVEH